MPRTAVLVIPCYNEADRLDREQVVRLAAGREGLRLVLVDDGSTDATPACLAAVASQAPGRITTLRLARNSGKAEAVRRGLLDAIAGGAEVVGYTDADLSTPVDELLRMVADLEARPVDVLLGSRVRLLGTRIDRKLHRHLLGRVFATFASIALRLPVYDTQCGAKLFRVTPALAAALRTPFRSRWIFDVELLARLLEGAPGIPALDVAEIRELPLQVWRDVAGSKLRMTTALWSGLQLLGLLVSLRLRGFGRDRSGPGQSA